MMRSQAIAHPEIEWIDGYVDSLPLFEKSADVAIVMLAFHYFTDYRQALREIHRIVGIGYRFRFIHRPAALS